MQRERKRNQVSATGASMVSSPAHARRQIFASTTDNRSIALQDGQHGLVSRMRDSSDEYETIERQLVLAQRVPPVAGMTPAQNSFYTTALNPATWGIRRRKKQKGLEKGGKRKGRT